MMNKRMKNASFYAPKVVLREVWNIISKGTFINPFKTSYDARWVFVFSSDFQRNIGVVFFDLSTLKLNIGQFQDDESYNKFRTLCSQLRPIEIIYNKDKQREELINIWWNSPNPPAKSGLPAILWGNTFSCLTKLEKYFSMDKSKWPKLLIDILLKIAKWELAFSWLSMTISYLQKSMLDEQVIQLASYQLYDPEMIKSSKMILDSQALEHLQILEVQGATKKEKAGSLFKILDNTWTRFGRRNFKRWVTTPLCNIDMINDRLDAVEDLMYHLDEFNKFRELIKELPDLEKNLSTIYQYSITQNKRAVYFENINLKKLKEFFDLVSVLKLLPKLLKPLTNISISFMSKRLKQIVSCNKAKEVEEIEDGAIPNFESLDNEHGLFPDIEEELKEFESMIQWTESETNEQIPEPKSGIDPDFDKANSKVSLIKDKFYDYLVEIQKQFGDISIKYSHAKYRFELEIPEHLIRGNKKPLDYEFTSSRKGYQRFHTSQIKKLIDELEDAEESVSEALVPFICSIFTHFYSKRDVWDRAVCCLAEIDWLWSLAWVSMDPEWTMTRPRFIDFEKNKFHSYLELKQMRHPGVESTGVKFIPNDTVVGKRFDIDSSDSDYIDSVSTLLISGPNMGGKSTLLRQTWIAVIMAQIGCFVPAESWVLTPVDRIFTRIGASDSIFEGKSVFFMEMEETKQIVENATSQSLVIMDELGRGTSTFDGFAIAKASLNYILRSIRVS